MVDKHIKEIEKSVFPDPKEGEEFMDNYLRQVNILETFFYYLIKHLELNCAQEKAGKV